MIIYVDLKLQMLMDIYCFSGAQIHIHQPWLDNKAGLIIFVADSGRPRTSHLHITLRKALQTVE